MATAQFDSIVQELMELWGGRMPVWEEFKAAHYHGRVRASKLIANQVFWDVDIPRFPALLWGFIVPSVGVLVALAAPFVLHFLWKVSYWLIPVIWIGGFWLLFKLLQESACEAVKNAAARNQRVYTGLVSRGMFLFSPQDAAQEITKARR